jgi:hypothetical protein
LIEHTTTVPLATYEIGDPKKTVELMALQNGTALNPSDLLLPPTTVKYSGYLLSDPANIANPISTWGTLPPWLIFDPLKLTFSITSTDKTLVGTYTVVALQQYAG